MIIFVGLYTGSQLFQMLESAINLIWRSRVRRSFWHSRVMALAMVVSVGVLLFAASLLVNAVHILRFYRIPLLDCHLSHLPWLNNAILGGIIPLLLLTAIFALIYSALPTMRVTLRTVMPGAISAAVVWLASLHLFSWYVTRHFEAYSFLYGSLARLVVTMVWFYYSAFIMLLGAEISATFHARLAAAGDTDEQNVENSIAADMQPVLGGMPAITESDTPAH
jgi:membrane protein